MPVWVGFITLQQDRLLILLLLEVVVVVMVAVLNLHFPWNIFAVYNEQNFSPAT